MGPSDHSFLRRTVQFSRVITPVENIQVWNTTSDGFSFVISFASRSGPGFRGKPGFIASWRPIYQNRSAVKVIGSPFKTFPEAEKACEAVLWHLKQPSGVKDVVTPTQVPCAPSRAPRSPRRYRP